MLKKAIFFDLDNTIYPVAAIGATLFQPLFELISQSGEFKGDFKKLKAAVMRKPFQHVADLYEMSESLKEQAILLLKNLSYNESINSFPDYGVTKKLPQEKFLITAGFTKLQLSKVHQLGIENDFKEVHIVDQTINNATKQSIFAEIILSNQYATKDVIVVGDDPESEIKAAKELGIDAIVYDSFGMYGDRNDLTRITDFKELEKILR